MSRALVESRHDFQGINDTNGFVYGLVGECPSGGKSIAPKNNLVRTQTQSATNAVTVRVMDFKTDACGRLGTNGIDVAGARRCQKMINE